MGRFFLAITTVLLLSTCQRTSDPLIGRWEVERVNVEFDESKATPEMVRQYGEMEKDNIIEIREDSTLVVVSGGDTLCGSVSLRGQRLVVDEKCFGYFIDNQIITDETTPLGKVTVYYHK